MVQLYYRNGNKVEDFYKIVMVTEVLNSMGNIHKYKDIIAFHPGYYINEIIEDMGITQTEFAVRMNTTPKTISKLVNGECNLSNDLIQKLFSMLGLSAEFWLNLQNKYEEKVLEIEKMKK